ncbi:hypothetical protein D3C84_124800 [compost metagenome]
MGAAIEQAQGQVTPDQHLLQLHTALGAGARQDETDARPQGAQTHRRIEKQRTQARHLAAPTARQQGHHGTVLGQVQSRARRRPIGLQGNRIGQWMTDETHRHLMGVVELRLERKQGQHQVAGVTNLQHAFLPPGPDGGTDVVHGLDPGTAQFEFEAQVEIRRIDADEQVRFGVDQGLEQASASRQQLRQAAEHFDQAHHRQALHGEIGTQALGLHERAADTDELDLWMTGLQGLHQAGTENVAGGFACHQRDAQ